MAYIPCPIHVNCPGQAGDLEFDYPLPNFSSEAPDPDLWFGNNFGWNNNVPPLGWTYKDPFVPGFCASPVSQAAADLCAGNNQIVLTYQGYTTPKGTTPQTATNQNQSCSWTCADGLLFTWTIAAGFVVAPTLQQANTIAYSLACSNAAGHHMCLGNIHNACINQAYNQTISVDAGGAAKVPFTFVIINGSLPPGLVLAQSPTQAFISGTPTTAGNYSFTLRVTDANGNFMQKVYNLPVLSIDNINSLATFGTGTVYSQQLTVSGGTGPYTFVLVGGSLPPGLTLSSSGLISGTATSGPSTTFTVQVLDANKFTCQQQGTLTFNPCAPFFAGITWNTLDSFSQNNGVYTNLINGNVLRQFGSVASNALSDSFPQINVGFDTPPASSTLDLDCHVTVQVNSWSGGDPTQSSFFLLINDLNAGVILSVSQSVPTSSGYQIHIPKNHNLEIIMQVSFASGNGPSFAGSYDVQVTLGS